MKIEARSRISGLVSYVGRTLGVFFRKTNLGAISPVVIFDGARRRIDNLPDTNRFHYGIGSGLRFSLMSVDFTAGYSFHPPAVVTNRAAPSTSARVD